MARLSELPAEICWTLVSWLTPTYVELLAVFPSPSWPLPLAPHAAPSLLKGMILIELAPAAAG
jgi:hypothetical protein